MHYDKCDACDNYIAPKMEEDDCSCSVLSDDEMSARVVTRKPCDYFSRKEVKVGWQKNLTRNL